MAIFHRHRGHDDRGHEGPERAEVHDDPVEGYIPRISGQDLLEWGMPGHCPECGSFGYLDRIDLVDEVMYQHCPSCHHHWQISKREIEVSAAQAMHPGD